MAQIFALVKMVVTSATGLVNFVTNIVQPVKVTCEFSPVQDGSGDPSPDNVRPISGWTGCNIYHSGADTSDPSVIPIAFPASAGTVYGGTVTLNEDGSADVYVPIYGYHIMPSQWTWRALSKVWIINRTSLTPRYKYYGDHAESKIKVLACDKYKPYTYNYQKKYTVAINEWNAQLLALITDGTNTVTPEECTVLLELAEPLTYHFDNIGQLQSFIGTNNIWHDMNGSITAEYWKKQ